MPELPEVETVVRTLRPVIIGRRILNAEFRQLRVLIGDPSDTAQALAGRKVKGVDRHGKFGRIEYGDELPARVAALGPEPLEVTLDDFARALRERRSPIKAVLLNQAVVRGVGNIYADETLFRAGIAPKRIAASLTRPHVKRIYDQMRAVLTEAIDSRGSSVSNYVDAEGRKGSFQDAHRVYRRTGEPCVKCGAPIQRILVAQRGTHYCPRCQK